MDGTSETSVGSIRRVTGECSDFQAAASSLMLEGIRMVPNNVMDNSSDVPGIRSNEYHSDVNRDIWSESVSA